MKLILKTLSTGAGWLVAASDSRFIPLYEKSGSTIELNIKINKILVIKMGAKKKKCTNVHGMKCAWKMVAGGISKERKNMFGVHT